LWDWRAVGTIALRIGQGQTARLTDRQRYRSVAGAGGQGRPLSGRGSASLGSGLCCIRSVRDAVGNVPHCAALRLGQAAPRDLARESLQHPPEVAEQGDLLVPATDVGALRHRLSACGSGKLAWQDIHRSKIIF
jgi:hypothetical protein